MAKRLHTDGYFEFYYFVVFFKLLRHLFWAPVASSKCRPCPLDLQTSKYHRSVTSHHPFIFPAISPLSSEFKFTRPLSRQMIQLKTKHGFAHAERENILYYDWEVNPSFSNDPPRI